MKNKQTIALGIGIGLVGALVGAQEAVTTVLPAQANLLTDAGPIIGGLMVLGAVLKHAFPKFPNRLIPLITTVAGTGAYLMLNGDFSANGVITALLVSTAATGIHSGIKNSFVKDEKNSTPTPPAVPVVFLAALLACGASGCSSPGITKAFVRSSVQTSVALGTLKHPEAVPFLRAAAPVVCSAAAGTNVAPAEVIAALEASDAARLKTPEGVILLNAVLSIYITLYDEFGGDIDEMPQLQAWLEGTCEGIQLGLPTPILRPGTKVVTPHIK